jgi:hypothetical protein
MLSLKTFVEFQRDPFLKNLANVGEILFKGSLKLTSFLPLALS